MAPYCQESKLKGLARSLQSLSLTAVMGNASRTELCSFEILVMRSRHLCTGIRFYKVHWMRGEGVPVPPENGFQVKIRLSYPNRELKFSGLLGASVLWLPVRMLFWSSALLAFASFFLVFVFCCSCCSALGLLLLLFYLCFSAFGFSALAASALLPLWSFARCFCSFVRNALLLLLPCACSAASALLFHVL